MEKCRIKENESHIEKVKGGGNLRLFLDSRPCQMHFFAPVNIVNDDDCSIVDVWYDRLPVVHSCFKGMISVDEGEVNLSEGLQDGCERIINISAQCVYIIYFQIFPD